MNDKKSSQYGTLSISGNFYFDERIYVSLL